MEFFIYDKILIQGDLMDHNNIMFTRRLITSRIKYANKVWIGWSNYLDNAKVRYDYQEAKAATQRLLISGSLQYN